MVYWDDIKYTGALDRVYWVMQWYAESIQIIILNYELVYCVNLQYSVHYWWSVFYSSLWNWLPATSLEARRRAMLLVLLDLSSPHTSVSLIHTYICITDHLRICVLCVLIAAREDMRLKQTHFDPKYPDAGELKAYIHIYYPRCIHSQTSWSHPQTSWSHSQTI